ncbi:DUF6542 domain-containing protein [Nocardia brasiliensis]|uniref:DUF6542 domain-containing protein n=1 Tax=Nocardia brasiliensis TaxID=37326 RepID=UPI0018931B42|nr:DUF6542 domain-containing protein [Nocardia brasiliensis]MBF6544107.1 hypothetical protein [Nocardia brasiliensis]
MAASQRVRSRVPAPHRSTLPTVPGIPVGAAVLIAVACTFLGFLIDAHGDATDLTGTFAALYIVGCVAAVLAVRYRGLFTTMVLPPLLLSIAVPLAYQQLTGRPASSIKDVLLNLAVPLVQRFPTMMLATVLVLMIGGGRILLQRRIEQADSGAESRRGESWGRSSAKRPRGGRERGSSLTDSARRRTRRPKDDPDEADLDEITPRPSRRTATAPVADAPPRVAGSARPREGRPAARGAARPTAAMPRTDSDPARGNTARRRSELPPPHPQPNVRYRERDSSRTERRRPENL